MTYLIFLIPLLFFFFTLYKLVKDDYLLIRKNVPPEQVFDIAIVTCVISLIIARFLSLIEQNIPISNLLPSFFSPNIQGLSLVGLCVGGLIGLYIVGRYKKVPIGRLFDFFSLSFLVSLPFSYLLSGFFLRGFPLVLTFFNGLFYLIVMTAFLKLLYPRTMNRALKDGIVSLLFLLIFSLTSFCTAVIPNGKIQITLTIENVLLGFLFIFSVVFLILLEQNVLKGRRYRR